jgi:uncharacterized protein YxjI
VRLSFTIAAFAATPDDSSVLQLPPTPSASKAGPTYEITRNGELAALVKKHLFTLMRCKFTVDVPGPDDLEAQGNFLDMEYTFTRAGQVVAKVSKRWFTFVDSYGVDVQDGEDDVLILASTVVIDMVCHGNHKNR